MEKVWYYTKNGQDKFGPYSEEELVKLIQQGILIKEDQIWMMDLEEWIAIGDSIYSFYFEQSN